MFRKVVRIPTPTPLFGKNARFTRVWQVFFFCSAPLSSPPSFCIFDRFLVHQAGKRSLRTVMRSCKLAHGLQGLRWSQMRPRWLQDCSRWPLSHWKSGTNVDFPLGFCCFCSLGFWPQDGFKMAPRSSKIVTRGLKMAPRWPEMVIRVPKMEPTWILEASRWP